MNRDKLLDFYNHEIKKYNDQIEILNKELFLIKNIVSNSQTMLEKIYSGEFDDDKEVT